MLGKDVDLWTLAQNQPQLFRKGGDYYQQVISRYGTQLEDNTHLQFKELPNKTFAYNSTTESLDLCLGECAPSHACILLLSAPLIRDTWVPVLLSFIEGKIQLVP